MKRTLFLIATLCIALTGAVFGALGDTEDQAADLFGKPIDESLPDKRGISTNMYKKGNYIILVQFLRHLSLAESYTRDDSQEFSQDEISALLDGNSNGRAWEKDPNKLAWERDDHKARAWCENLSGRPTFLIQAK